MGRLLPVLVLAAVFPAVSVAQIGEPGGSGASATPTGSAPALRVLKREPLIVQGLRFAAQERVVVTLHEPKGAARMQATATADAQGSFTTDLGNEPRGRSRCDRLIRAVGNRGNHALLKLLPAPACLPA